MNFLLVQGGLTVRMVLNRRIGDVKGSKTNQMSFDIDQHACFNMSV